MSAERCPTCGCFVASIFIWITGETIVVDAGRVAAIILDETFDPSHSRTGRTEEVFVEHRCRLESPDAAL